jgi:hypothetical protein
MAQAKHVGQKKTDLVQKIAQLTAAATASEQTVTKNLVMINELRAQKAKSGSVLDPSALVYIQSLGQDAHRDLQRFLYYVVKAYEYYTVRPWGQSYIAAQKTFESLRKILEPSDSTFDFDADPSGDKKKRLQALINQPESRKDGVLTDEEFDLLKEVYQKPLRDMGKRLADELMRGSGKIMETSKPVTLDAGALKELNARIADSTRADAIPISLVKLRQVEATRERQRISNIKVVSVTAKQAGPRFPDQVIFKFTLTGKSIVRADNRLYAFDPEVPAGADGATLPGLTFETDGGRRGDGWKVAPDGSGTLNPTALWQLTVTAQENLLSTLMADSADSAKQLISLSQFRPGVYSDFTLTVEFQPAECTLQFGELVLDLSLETGDAGIRSVLVAVDNNLDLAIPFVANRKDRSGRQGGEGRFIGLYDDQSDLSHNPIRLSVPERFGRYRHIGWLVNGQPTPILEHHFDVSKSQFLTALYQDEAQGVAVGGVIEIQG